LVFNVSIAKVRNPKTANAIKLIENTFRDVNIALMNELALLCEKLGVDITEVLSGCATKWNFIPHYPGPGVGGACLSTSSLSLISQGTRKGSIPSIIQVARRINNNMPNRVVTLVEEGLRALKKLVHGSKIAILGITYKPDVRDLSGTPVLPICTHLKEKGASVAIYDPFFKGETIERLSTCETLSEAIEGADCILLGTSHTKFKNLKLSHLAKKCRMPAVFVDSRNFVNPTEAIKCGFLYKGIGRTAENNNSSN